MRGMGTSGTSRFRAVLREAPKGTSETRGHESDPQSSTRATQECGGKGTHTHGYPRHSRDGTPTPLPPPRGGAPSPAPPGHAPTGATRYPRTVRDVRGVPPHRPQMLPHRGAASRGEDEIPVRISDLSKPKRGLEPLTCRVQGGLRSSSQPLCEVGSGAGRLSRNVPRNASWRFERRLEGPLDNAARGRANAGATAVRPRAC